MVRLKKLNYINNNKEARGYLDYTKTELYQKRINKNKKNYKDNLPSNDIFNFKNAGEPWTNKEYEKLNQLYNIDKLDLIEIMKQHQRAAGGICSRLKRL